MPAHQICWQEEKEAHQKFKQWELSRQDSNSFKPEEVLQEVRGLLEQQQVMDSLQNEAE